MSDYGDITPNLDNKFVDYSQYQLLGGEMTQEEYLAVQQQREDMKVGLKKILAFNIGLPPQETTLVFSKIDAKFPDKDDFWKLTETYLCMGKSNSKKV